MDWQRLLQMIPAGVAGASAATGNSQEAGALMRGLTQGRLMRQREQMQQQELDRRGQLDQSTLDTQAAQRSNLEADNQRAADAAKQQKLMQALGMLTNRADMVGQSATDATAAESQLLGDAGRIESMFGIPQGQLSPAIPPMAPVVSGRKKKQAEELYAKAEKLYGPEAMAQDSITLQTGELFGDVKPSQLRAMFAPSAVTAGGAPAQLAGPVGPPPDEFTLGPGQARFKDGRMVASVPSKPETAPREPQTKIWVMRNGRPARVRDVDVLPTDQPYNTRENLRNVTSGDAGRIAELDTSLDDLNTLERDIGQTGATSKVGALLPNVVTELTGWGSDAKSRQAVIDRVKQVIGKALEGGVLRREDEYKYVKILPTIGDPPEVATSKIAGLRTAIQQRKDRLIDSLGDAEYDVTRYRNRGQVAPQDTAVPPPGGSGSKRFVIEKVE